LSIYLLDTNIVSDLLRNPAGRIRRRISQVGSANVFIDVVIAAELKFGIAKKRSDKLAKQLETILKGLSVLPIEVPVDQLYAGLRADLERAGTPIGANDMFIAAHALSLDAVLVTDNDKEFLRIANLKVENWLR